MKNAEAEAWLRQRLQRHYPPGESQQMASLVMEHLTGNSRQQRLAHGKNPLSPTQQQTLQAMEQRLAAHEPVQYVLGEAYFGNLKLFVNKEVLIPRPETEELVHWIVSDVKASGKPVFGNGLADRTTLLKVLDVGTGSGCIALLLKQQMPLAELWGCDASEGALNVARRNGAALDIRVDFVGLDFLDETQRRQLPTVDIIVSNPPYIAASEKPNLAPNVAAHEPHAALFVPDEDPLIFYRALAFFGKERLYPNGTVYVEIHEDRSPQVVQLFEQQGYQQVQLKKDMQGKDRMVKATWVSGEL